MRAFLISSVWILLSSAACAASVKVSWEKNAEPDIDAYKILWVADNSQAGGSHTAAAGDTSVVLDGFAAGATYRFTLVAVNTAGMKSDPSDEAAYTVPGGETPDPPDFLFEVGDVVTTGTNRVNIRKAPGLGGEWIVTQPAGAIGVVLKRHPQEVDTFRWLRAVWEDGTEGWSGDDLLSAAELPTAPPRKLVGWKWTMQHVKDPEAANPFAEWTDTLSIITPAGVARNFGRLKVEPVYEQAGGE